MSRRLTLCEIADLLLKVLDREEAKAVTSGGAVAEAKRTKRRVTTKGAK